MEIKISDELNAIINYARQEAMRTGSYGIAPDHFFLAIIRHGNNTACDVLKALETDIEEFKQFIDSRIFTNESIPYAEADHITFSRGAQNVLSITVLEASRTGSGTASSQHLLLALGRSTGGYGISCTYSWTYEKFVISDATGYDVLKKVQEECGADIYLDGGVLHVHAPGEQVGRDVYYDFAQNVQECDLEYRRADERRVRVKVKALLPDGTVKEREYGTTGGDSVEVRSASADEESMRLRGESEYKKLSFDGYEGSITTWLVPSAVPGDSAVIHDADYEYKDGKYFIQSVTTSFSAEGAARKVELGFRLS